MKDNVEYFDQEVEHSFLITEVKDRCCGKGPVIRMEGHLPTIVSKEFQLEHNPQPGGYLRFKVV